MPARLSLFMNATTDSTDSPRRRPGGGRKPGLYEPVTIVSVSMPPELLRIIDREAFQSNRSRSSFCRWVLRARCGELEQQRDDRPPAYRESYVLDDPTHGGRFNPELIGGEPWDCHACAEATKDDELGLSNQKVVSGWLICPGCKTPRPEA